MTTNQETIAIAARITAALPSQYGYEKGFRDALESMILALAGTLSPSDVESAVTTALDAYGNNADHEASNGRVLVTVSGGIADYVCDADIEVVIFDHDDFTDDPDNTDKVPMHFADLAAPIDVPIADDGIQPIAIGQEYEFYAEMQEAELPAPERMRNYTGQKVTVVSGPEPKDEPDTSDCFVVRAADGREFTAAEEELNGWDKVLGQFFWPDGTYGHRRERTYLTNETAAAAQA